MAEIIVSFPDYNEMQQIYCASAASNAVGKQAGTTEALEAGFRKTLDEMLPQLSPVGRWTTAWGPAVYKKNAGKKETGPLNAWFVGQNHQDKVLVVAIAGTSSKSTYAAIEDCDVNKVVDFDAWTAKWSTSKVPDPVVANDKTGSLASLGTCKFLSYILNYASPELSAAPGTRLAQFLKDFQGENPTYKIVFTGHSLGGAVSPALALGLIQAGILTNQEIEAMPSAGASPGNAAFNESFSSTLKQNGRINANAYNTLDIVPQAWCTDPSQDRNLDNIPIIYASAKKQLGWINPLVRWAKARSQAGTQYIGLPGDGFTGPGIPTDPDQIDRRDLVLAQIMLQHTAAYWQEIGITDFVEALENTLKQQPGVRPAPDDVAVDWERIIAHVETIDE